jgi:hypothetical protein
LSIVKRLVWDENLRSIENILRKKNLARQRQKRLWSIIGNFVVFLFLSSQSIAAIPDNINAVYLPAHKCSDRKISELIHYADIANLNAVVIHVKDPFGKISWKSNHPIARAMGTRDFDGSLERIVKRLKDNHIWTIAKIDIFVDHQLVSKYPEMGLINTQTDSSWADQNGLFWANPYDRRVWDYNITLCKELIAFGFDEIQFDYIRFPSDGNLAAIHYPFSSNNLTKSKSIGRFLKTAYTELKPLDVVISVDVFGLTAWKTTDFGVGQVLEEIAPYVDVICPMFYPSHFPVGFLGKKVPGDYPLEIMELSMKRIQKRTSKKIRPWIQGFWYKPEKIMAQLDGVANAGASSWAVWNPSANYAATYRALAQRMNSKFPAPIFYPAVTEIRNNNDRIVQGHTRIVNLTNYRKGYTIISLEESKNQYKSAYSTLISVLNTVDEGIMDRILRRRNIPFHKMTDKITKNMLIVNLLSKDLAIDSRRMRPMPIYIDWDNTCRFTQSVPKDGLYSYLQAARSGGSSGIKS